MAMNDVSWSGRLCCCSCSSSSVECKKVEALKHRVRVKACWRGCANGILDLNPSPPLPIQLRISDEQQQKQQLQARAALESMEQRATVAQWNFVISRHAANGQSAGEALRLYERMQLLGYTPDRVTILVALKACLKLLLLTTRRKHRLKPVQGAQQEAVQQQRDQALAMARGIHAVAKRLGLQQDAHIANALATLYSTCGSMADAGEAFNVVLQPDAVLWACIISAHTRSGDFHAALQLFFQRRQAGCSRCYSSQAILFAAKANACLATAAAASSDSCSRRTLQRCLERGRSIEVEAAAAASADMFVETALVDMFIKCGSMAEASRIFERMQQRDAVCWNLMIGGYARNGEGEAALNMFSRMQNAEERIFPNAVTFVAAVGACAALAEQESSTQIARAGALKRGKELHQQAMAKGHFEDANLQSALVDMYAKAGSIADARQVFDNMLEKSVVAWSSIILGYAENGNGDEALCLFSRMLECCCCCPNSVTLIAALKACSVVIEKEMQVHLEGGKIEELRSGMQEKGRWIHRLAAQLGCASDSYVGNTLVHTYAKCGCMEEARTLLAAITLGSVHGPVHCTSAVPWNCIISGCASSGQSAAAVEHFYLMMQNGLRPTEGTFAAVFKACGGMGALQTGRGIHEQARERCMDEHPVVASSLVDMYGKCGCMPEAETVFWTAEKRDVKAWGSLIAGYSRCGDGADRVFQLFERMVQHQHDCGEDDGDDCSVEERIRPDAAIFTSLLAACGRAGMVAKAKAYFDSMLPQYGVCPQLEHYTCMVDLLGKAGLLDDALQLLLLHEGSIVSATSTSTSSTYGSARTTSVCTDTTGRSTTVGACSDTTGRSSTSSVCTDTTGMSSTGTGMSTSSGSVRLWIALLDACCRWKNARIGKVAFDSVIRLQPTNAAAYVLMSNIYRQQD